MKSCSHEYNQHKKARPYVTRFFHATIPRQKGGHMDKEALEHWRELMAGEELPEGTDLDRLLTDDDYFLEFVKKTAPGFIPC